VPNPAPRRPIYYGWWIVLSATLANFAYAVNYNSNYGAYVFSMGVDMGWSRTALSAVQSVGQIPAAFTSVLVGPLVDRHGSRWLVGLGALIMGAGFFALATIQDLWQLYLFRGVFVAIGASCLGGFLGVTVSNWFVAKRGRALAFVSMGASAGSATLPLLTAFIIDNAGWRASWAVQGVLLTLLVVPAVVFFRRRPEDIGLHPDGIEPGTEVAPKSAAQRRRQAELLAADVPWTRRQAMGTAVFWLMTFTYGTAAMALTATNLHLIPFIEDLGYPLALGAAAVSLRATTVLLVSPGWGLAVERLPLRLIQTVPLVLQAVAMLAFFLWPTVPGILAGLLLYGVGNGGTSVMYDAVWAHYFGRISLGTVRSAYQPIQSLMGAIGPLAMGVIFDISGSYQKSWLLLFCLFSTAAVLVQFARRPRPAPLLPQPSTQS
jgi:MFS family permease